MEPGCYYYFGATGFGKTYLARKHLEDGIKSDGRPSLIIDAMPSESFVDLPHEPDPKTCLVRLVKGFHAVYTPRDLGEIAYLIRGIHEYGAIRVLWDEAANHMASSMDADQKEIAAKIRGWRHAGLKFGRGRSASYHVTTQRPSELPPVFWTTAPEVYCFFLEFPTDLETIRDRCRFDPAEIYALGYYEFKLYGKDRFDKCRKPAPGSPPAAPAVPAPPELPAPPKPPPPA